MTACITVVGGGLHSVKVSFHAQVSIFLVRVGIVFWFHPGNQLLVAIACIEFFGTRANRDAV